MREETRAEEEEEEEEARRRRRLKARCRAEVFEYSGVVPAQLVKSATTTSSNACLNGACSTRREVVGTLQRRRRRRRRRKYEGRNEDARPVREETGEKKSGRGVESGF